MLYLLLLLGGLYGLTWTPRQVPAFEATLRSKPGPWLLVALRTATGGQQANMQRNGIKVFERRRDLHGLLRDAFGVVLDTGCVCVALVMALAIRFDLQVPADRVDRALPVFAVAVLAQLAVGLATGLYPGRYRPASFEETLVIVRTTLTATAITVAADVFLLDRAAPLSVALAYGPLTMLGTFVARGLWRADQERRIRRSSAGAAPLVVMGAGEAGCQIVGQLLRTRGCSYRPVALLDDDPGKQRHRVHGVSVVGTGADLVEVASRHGATTVLLALPSADKQVLRTLAGPAAQAGLTVLVLPSVVDLFGTDVRVADIRPITEEDLLGRGEAAIDIDAIADYLTGHSVLVTGAGGSIGSELCRQVHRFAPSELIMLDRDESALHGVELSISGRALLDHPNLVVCDIRDVDRLDQVFAEHQPEVVFHAAALKHLPLLEMHPSEAVKSNCTGTLNVLRAATAHGVDRFVNISTDKAADPISVLGLTKRIAERITSHWSNDHRASFLSVRFGNVLGSRGSVLTTFRTQVVNGGPITVTDRDVTRFFMTTEEAVRLVIQAGALDLDGHVLVLDMGEPVRIDDVARRLAAAAERPVEIIYTGLRRGEKRHEALVSNHEVGARTRHPLITEVPVTPLDPAGLDRLDLRRPAAELAAELRYLISDEPLHTPAPSPEPTIARPPPPSDGASPSARVAPAGAAVVPPAAGRAVTDAGAAPPHG